MSLVTGLDRLSGRILSPFIWQISALSTRMKFKNQIQMAQHKVVSFVTIVALSTLVT